MMLALLIAAVPAFASEAVGRVQLDDGARTHNAVLAAKALHKQVVGSGEEFSFNALVGPRTAERGFVPAVNGAGEEIVGLGCAQAATALYNALTGLGGAVSFDELSYASDGSGLLVDYDSGRDFRFTNLAPGAMQIVFGQSGDMLMCKVVLEDAAFDGSAPDKPPLRRGTDAIVFECIGDDSVLSNIALAVDSIHDTVLVSGDVFSFNDIVGPRDERFGYVPAPDGRGEVVIGGGVDQVASALWLLLQGRDDIAIVEKSTYGDAYNQSYVAHSSDAILVDYPITDFAFRYTGSGSITLYALLESTFLSLTL